ncbi:hypothetical protein [Micromonospora deserti]|uniref:hypothetical protein n=1 Tax=Micromonospora deserti TaxID=2070366 RepID=UPI000DA89259|nr:hypothetical protein [Micromonospora deserti]
MSGFAAADRADPRQQPCRRLPVHAYRCACGRLRDRCVRATVRALWSPARHPDSPAASRPGRPTQAG